jgi:uncharacterized phage protein (TIGR02220 family)
MANLLLSERPLVVLPSLAEALGSVDKAIIIQQLNYWVKKSKNYHDGRPWVYNSMDSWAKQFPWIKSKTTIKKHFKDLKKLGLVLTGNFNQYSFDRTTWYTIDYEAFEQFSNDFFAKKAAKKQEDADQSIGQELAQEEPKNGPHKGQNLPNDNGQKLAQQYHRLPETTTETTTYTAEQAKSLPEEMQEKEKKEKIPYKKILDYLNQKTGKGYRNVPGNQDLIRARWNEGYRFDDFVKVIDNMVAEWKGTGFTFSSGELAEKYLRPSTLFSKKFDKYLNQTVNGTANNIPEEYQGLFDQQPEYNAETEKLPF